MAGRLGVVTLAEAVSYLPMLRAQEALSAMVKRGDLPSLALALTHKPVFTLGKRGEEGDILERDASNLVTARGERIEVVRSNPDHRPRKLPRVPSHPARLLLPFPRNFRRRICRARFKRDITVPMGIFNISEISL